MKWFVSLEPRSHAAVTLSVCVIPGNAGICVTSQSSKSPQKRKGLVFLRMSILILARLLLPTTSLRCHQGVTSRTWVLCIEPLCAEVRESSGSFSLLTTPVVVVLRVSASTDTRFVTGIVSYTGTTSTVVPLGTSASSMLCLMCAS